MIIPTNATMEAQTRLTARAYGRRLVIAPRRSESLIVRDSPMPSRVLRAPAKSRAVVDWTIAVLGSSTLASV
jgi:hypothetical protein